jgi:pyruvate dehydrogenase E2 component (dihydrolipoamide acetyltransferase)
MSVSVTMPRLGESVSEGTVTRWLKNQGDRVEADEPLLEVSTDKVDTEIPAPASGVLSAIKVGEDETVEVGAELATIDDTTGGEGAGGAEAGAATAAGTAEAATAGGTAGTATAGGQPAPPAQARQQPEPAERAPHVRERPADPARQPSGPPPRADGPAQGQPAAARPAAGTVDDDQAAYVTPLVRKLAAEHGVDLATLDGTGVGGRIRKHDVLEAARSVHPPADRAAKPAAAQNGTTPQPTVSAAAQALRGRTVKMSRLRAVIAERMVESLQVSAQLTTVVEVDVTRIARLRQRAKGAFEAREGVKLTFLPFFALATVEALKSHPDLNASIDAEQGTVTYHDTEHLGIAVDTDRGLLAPVIHDAGDLNLGGLARKIADLADRTRTGKVSPDELSGGTFTLTNTGSRGALFDTPIINQPQVGILGTGSVVKRAVVVDDPELGEIMTVRSMVYLALTYDHRLVDGANAARFLGTVRERLEGGRFEAALGL